MRIAFLTPEFVTEPVAGGLASYLSRIVVALRESGHTPEVFCRSDRADIIEYRGVRVERVPLLNTLAWRMIRGGVSLAPRAEAVLGPTLFHLRSAASLARAMERRHSETPFDVVQSSSFGLSGWFVRKGADRRHLVRASGSRELRRLASEGRLTADARLLDWAERRTIRKADAAYAPSAFLAEYFRRKHGLDVQVVRPPFLFDAAPAADLPFDLPARFLVHFGLLGPTKGTDVIAEALPLAWRSAPDLAMIWAGRESRKGLVDACRVNWGDRAPRVRWLGPLPKDQLYAVLQRAEAAVLPSRMDNLPNTLIECVALGVPVIGSDGVSIDELVEHDRNGLLVPIGDSEALARAMLRVWRGDVPWKRGMVSQPAVFQQMEPNAAAVELLNWGRPSDGRPMSTAPG